MSFSREFKSPFFVYCKKHFCPKCSTRLETVTVSKVVNSKSEEAKNFDFSHVETFLVGDVKFIWTEFKCPNCNFQIKIEDLKKLEREQKKVLRKMKKQ